MVAAAMVWKQSNGISFWAMHVVWFTGSLAHLEASMLTSCWEERTCATDPVAVVRQLLKTVH